MKALILLLTLPLTAFAQCPLPSCGDIPTVLNVLGAGAVLNKAFGDGDTVIQTAANAPQRAETSSPAPQAVPAQKVVGDVSAPYKGAKESRLNEVRDQRLAILDETADFLLPRKEDYDAVDPNDTYAKGWPEIFGPEGIRKKRILKAKAFLDDLTKDARQDLAASRNLENEDAACTVAIRKIEGQGALELKRDGGKLDLELKKDNGLLESELRKVDGLAQLVVKVEELKVKYDFLKKKAALTQEIINSIRQDKDIEVDLTDDGVISIRKGRQETQTVVAPFGAAVIPQK